MTEPFEPGADPGVPPITDMPDNDSRMWAMIAHLSSLLGLLGIPLANLIAPLIVWQIKKDQHPFIDDQGKEAVNFQITVTIALLVAGLLVCLGIGIILLPVVAVVAVAFAVIAGIQANKGVAYRYPLTIRMIK